MAKTEKTTRGMKPMRRSGLKMMALSLETKERQSRADKLRALGIVIVRLA